MASTPRDARTGKFTRVPVESAYADDSRFPTVAREGIDVENVSGAPSQYTIEERRHAPSGDELAQGGDTHPPGIRRQVMVRPDDMAHFNGALRSASRDAGPMDPSAYLTGVETQQTPATGTEETSDGR